MNELRRLEQSTKDYASAVQGIAAGAVMEGCCAGWARNLTS
jgi:hypothetical protein